MPRAVIDSEPAFAKVNLALHVRARRDDGFHDLDTLFAFADDGDQLSVLGETGARGEIRLTMRGPFANELSDGPDNLVVRAALLLQERSGTSQGALLVLDKKLPVASGLGGGSTDAAAALRLLNRYWKVGYPIESLTVLARELGSDVPACLLGGTALGSGRGDILNPIHNELKGAPMLLVNPGIAVSTGSVFAAWDGVDRGPLPGDTASIIVKQGRNDLAGPAIAICPLIADSLASLAVHRPIVSRMSGSGATCFALFTSKFTRDAAREAIIGAHPDWWTMACRLL